jgi:hypothetical protein
VTELPEAGGVPGCGGCEALPQEANEIVASRPPSGVGRGGQKSLLFAGASRRLASKVDGFEVTRKDPLPDPGALMLPRHLLGVVVEWGEHGGDQHVEASGCCVIGRCLQFEQPAKVILAQKARMVGRYEVAIACHVLRWKPQLSPLPPTVNQQVCLLFVLDEVQQGGYQASAKRAHVWRFLTRGIDEIDRSRHSGVMGGETRTKQHSNQLNPPGGSRAYECSIDQGFQQLHLVVGQLIRPKDCRVLRFGRLAVTLAGADTVGRGLVRLLGGLLTL